LLSVAVLLGLASAADDIFLGEDHKAGLVDFGDGDDMFYWLFKSKNDPAKDPLVMWLTGGPGCASEIALFYENGPFIINEDLSLRANEHSWHKVSNLLFVDQPIGTGFSKCSNPESHADTEEEVA
jgi:cathepsin A (carboxypeptidase C)